MLNAEEVALLEGVALNTASDEHRGATVRVVVTGCAYSCCGRGWQRRDGYEQTYHGWIDNLDTSGPGAFMLYSAGIGTISYVCAIRFSEVVEVEQLEG